MKKNLLLLALAVLAPAAFAKEPSFADLQSLESIDGYPLYGTPAEDADQAYIFIDGGAREGKIASIHVVSVFRGASGFAVVPGKTLAEYLRNGDRSTKFYTVQCANKTVREANLQANTQGTPVPFNRLRGVSKVAAGVVCNVEASGKAASQRRNGN